MLQVNFPITDLPERYAFLDPAGGKTHTVRKVAARSAIVVIAPDSLGRVFWLHSWAERCATDKLIEQVHLINEQWHPVLFGVEENAMQSLFIDAMDSINKLFGRSIPLTPVPQHTRIDKDFRIRAAIHPFWGHGKLLVNDSIDDDHKRELTKFPFTRTRDVVDALASAISLVPSRSSANDIHKEDQEFKQYLDETANWGNPVQVDDFDGYDH